MLKIEEFLVDIYNIGTYKTKDFKNFIYNNSSNPHLHAICGSLFIKYFSPLSHLSDIILYHHENINHYKNLDIVYQEESVLLNLLDKITLYINRNSKICDDTLSQILELGKGYPIIDQFKEVNEDENLIQKMIDGQYLIELYDFLNQIKQPKENTMNYVRMMMYLIDFRSESTLIHTITVTSLSKIIATKLGLSEEVTSNIAFAATVHDIGKIATPIEILEKPTRLTLDEMEIMKQHVLITHDILSCICSNEIIEMASYHHEKLDGSGYPFGLTSEQLSLPVRVVTISDILSALLYARSYKEEFTKKQIIGILEDLAIHDKIDSTLVKFVVNYYDELIAELTLESKPYIDSYLSLKKEYRILLNQKINNKKS